MKQLYQLKTTIANPDHDKRRRYGQEAIAEFKAGDKFVIWQREHTYLGASVDFGGPSISGILAGEIISNCEPVQPTTWLDIALVCGGYQSCADDTINQLLKTGVVTADQVAKALNDFLAN